MSVLDNLYHPEGHPFETRLVSTETDGAGNPLIEIQTEIKGDTKILILKFIRSKKPSFTFDSLLNDVLCYAEKNQYHYVKLEDDALFTMDENCMVRALIYRSFQNKNSIYVDRGFYPDSEDVELDGLKNIIYNFRIGDAKNLANFLPEDIHQEINSIDASLDNHRFGEWLLTTHCSFLRNVINRIEVLARKIETDPSSYESLTQDTLDFLRSFRAYYFAHTSLIKNAVCAKGGKGGARRKNKNNLRRTSRASQRKFRKHGKTRKNFGDFKIFKGASRRTNKRQGYRKNRKISKRRSSRKRSVSRRQKYQL